MDFNLTVEQQQIREEIRKVCKEFPDAYWREIDSKKAYPDAFVRKLSDLGWLAALIPEEFGGTGLGITEASIILEEINHSGGVATACHAQMYTMGTLLRHGNAEQKKRYLPKIATGELRLQAFGVTEPNAGSESTRIQTMATRKGDTYFINGQKIFISRVLQSDLMLLLARTTPYDDLKDKTRGLSVFIVDLREAKGKLEVKPLDLMINHHTNALFFDDVEVPAENLIGDEGDGFSLHHRRLERRAYPRRRRSDRRRPLVCRTRREICERAKRLRPSPSARIKAFNFPSPKPTPISKRRIWCASKQRRNSIARKNAARKPIWQSIWPRKRHGKPPTRVSRRTAAMALLRNTMWNENFERRAC